MGKPLKASDKNKPWAVKKKPRKKDIKPLRHYFLIICEGEKTEPNYFKSIKKELPRGTVNVKIFGEGKNTLSLVTEAQQIVNRHKKKQPTNR